MTMLDYKKAHEEELAWKSTAITVEDGTEEEVRERLRTVLNQIRDDVAPIAKTEGVALTANPYHNEKTEGDPHVTIRISPPHGLVEDALHNLTPNGDKTWWDEPEDLARGFALGTHLAYEAEAYADDMEWDRDDPDLPAALHVFLENYTLDGYSAERRILIRSLAQVTPTWRLPLLVWAYVWTFLKLRLGHSWRDE